MDHVTTGAGYMIHTYSESLCIYTSCAHSLVTHQHKAAHNYAMH